jgi:hypothetical protein
MQLLCTLSPLFSGDGGCMIGAKITSLGVGTFGTPDRLPFISSRGCATLKNRRFRDRQGPEQTTVIGRVAVVELPPTGVAVAPL